MSTELATSPKVVGAKQVRRALNGGTATRIYIAQDADPALLQPLEQLAQEKGVPVEQVSTMKQLGTGCGIAVGAAVAALISVLAE